MTDGKNRDDRISSWIHSGPDTASSDFVERTLRPIPRMRQRRSWRIGLERVFQPVKAPVAAALGIVVTVTALGIFVVILRPGGVAAPGPSSPPRPNFDLRLDAGPGAVSGVPEAAGSYVADLTSTLDLCTRAIDGSWRYLYSGGSPYINLDVLVGAGAGEAGKTNRVALELYAGKTYVVIDPAAMRGGDPPGRSQATISVQAGDDVTTFVISAITPDRSSGDVPSVKVDLTITCPN